MKKLLSVFLGFALLTSALAYTTPKAFAGTSKQTVCTSIGGFTAGDDCAEPTTGNVGGLIAAVINLLSMAVGILGVVMIIIGSAKYMTSGGDANAVSSAKKTIMYALVGLVLAALTQVLIRFVLFKATP